MSWDLSCVDWRERLRDGRSLVPELPLDHAAADRAVAVLNLLRLADVPGTPAFAEAGGEWFRGIVRALFGSVDPVTRERYIRELFLLVPKKNSKTTNAALLMVTALLLNQRPRADFLLTGPVQDTADAAFSAAAGAIALDPVLEAKLHVRDHLKTIVHRETKAELQIATFDPAILTGRKVVGGLIDEPHVLGKMPRAAKALLQLRGGMQPFPEAFLVMITTQSDEPPAGVFRDELHRAREIRDGERHGDALLPVLYEFPPEVQSDPAKPWRDPANWPLVTPNAGKSISIPRLLQACESEEQKGDAALRLWASQHLNIEIGIALHSDRWAGADFWQFCAAPEGMTLEQLIERSEVVVTGIDGGGLDDLLGFVALGRETGTGRWLAWSRAWAHRIVLERRKDIASQLLDFEKAHELVIVEKPGQDVEEVADLVEQIDAAGVLAEEAAVGVDQAGIDPIVNAIVDRKIKPERIVGVQQGWRLNGAIKTTERARAARTLLHGGSALLTWAVGNAKPEAHGNATVITKQRAGSAKIDPLMALFDAVVLMGMNPKARRRKFQMFFLGTPPPAPPEQPAA